ncbi:DMT family protein [Elioraea tepida]|uniref:DMT family protein n=1 Tax=Elioraea tepida TaxID=2843330 RepID=A0A975YIF5_9PROT|nr:DMT family protein [Elioraea tepida]QXM23486.1 DMT family protein [Elioraea tepida]
MTSIPANSWLAFLLPPLLLVGSNVLMTVAWYGHLKQPSWPLWLAVLVSWGIAFFEYCLAVPANRIGYGTYTAQQLKVMQEVITMAVFAGFAVLVLGERLSWNYGAAALCLVAAVVFIFLPTGK